MGYVDCPNCARRLRVPDVPGATTLRCPDCGHSFEAPAQDTPAGEAESTNILADEPDESLDQAYLSSAETVVGDAMGVGDTDLGSLDRFGVGSGLLELTHNSGDTSLGAAFRTSRAAPTAEPAPSGSTKASSAVAAAREQARQQMQIVKTALEMARKLEVSREVDLQHARRFALIGWAAAATLVIVALGLLWWGGSQAGQYKAERAISAGLSESLTRSEQTLREEKARRAELSENLQSARAEIRALQDRKDELQEQLMASRESLAGREGELRVAREDLATTRTEVQTGAVEINALQARIKTLEAELFLLRDKVTRNGQPTTQPGVEPGASPE